MGSERQRQDGDVTEASPPAALVRPAAGGSPAAASDRTATAGHSPSPSVDDRLLRATIDVVATVGYAAAEAADIVQAAGLSRTVFYRHFGGKRGATLAAARRVLDDLERSVGEALAAESTGARDPVGASGRDASAPSSTDRIRVLPALTGLAEALAADPPAAALLFVEAPAVGPGAQSLRDGLVALVDRILGDSPSGRSAWSSTGAVLHVLHQRIAAGMAPKLPALVPELVRALTRYVP